MRMSSLQITKSLSSKSGNTITVVGKNKRPRHFLFGFRQVSARFGRCATSQSVYPVNSTWRSQLRAGILVGRTGWERRRANLQRLNQIRQNRQTG